DGQLPDINLTRSLDGNMSIIKSSFIQEERTEIQGVDSYVYGVDPLKYAYFAEDVIDSMRNYTSSTFLYLYHSEGNYSVNATFGLVSEFLFQKLHSPLGSNVSVKIISNKTVNVTIAAVIKSNVFLGNGEYLYISTTRFQEFFNSTLAKWFVCDVEGDLAFAQVKTEIGFPQFKEVIAIDFYAKAMERSLAFQSAIFQILFIESFILAAIAQSICILVSTLRMEREMGIMRAIGLNKRGVFNIFMSESVILGFSALVIGVLNGLIGSILLAWYIRLSIPIEIEFPLNQIILWIVFSFLITVASTILVSYRSSSKSVIATIARRPFYHNYETVYLSQQVFYPFWNATASAHSVSTILESPLRSSLAHEQMKADYPHPSTSLWHFIKNHTLQIQVIYIVLLVVASFNYIFDGSIIIRGLNPFDIVWRLTITILPVKDYFNEYYPEMFLFTNPFFIILALAVIAPISYYFINDHPPANPIVHFGNNFTWGLVGLIFCFLTPFVLIAILITVILPVSIVFLIGLSSYSSSAIIFYFSVVITLTILGLELFLFQRLWVFLVFNGISSGYTFRQKITWVRKIGSKGQIKFIGFIFIHSLIQYLLFLLFQPTKEGIIAEIPNPFPLSIVFPLSKLFVNPVVFFILITFEIGFFLFLIIYQIVQFQNQSHLFFPDTTLEPSTKRTILTIHETDIKYPPTSQKKDN
ncbi:MAG: ABC transporter permease, partial [Candidatus Hodarchaeota archaeon]